MTDDRAPGAGASGRRRRTGRPPLTDRRSLLAAARGIGFDGLTVGAVTAAAGVKYSTFYRHFPSLDALTSALVDHVCADELELPGPGRSWQESVLDTCVALTRVLDRYPGMSAAVVSLPEWPAEVLALYRRMTDELVAAGLGAERAALAAVCALEIVAVTQMTTPGARHSSADRQREVEMLDPPVDAGVRRITAALVDQPTSAWVARKIALLVGGLEADLAAAAENGRRWPAHDVVAAG